MNVEQEDANHIAHDWKEEVKLNPKLDAYQYRLIGMMIQFESS